MFSYFWLFITWILCFLFLICVVLLLVLRILPYLICLLLMFVITHISCPYSICQYHDIYCSILHCYILFTCLCLALYSSHILLVYFPSIPTFQFIPLFLFYVLLHFMVPFSRWIILHFRGQAVSSAGCSWRMNKIALCLQNGFTNEGQCMPS